MTGAKPREARVVSAGGGARHGAGLVCASKRAMRRCCEEVWEVIARAELVAGAAAAAGPASHRMKKAKAAAIG